MLTFQECLRRMRPEEGEILTQSIAILSTQEPFRNMSPEQVFDHVARQAAGIAAKSQ